MSGDEHSKPRTGAAQDRLAPSDATAEGSRGDNDTAGGAPADGAVTGRASGGGAAGPKSRADTLGPGAANAGAARDGGDRPYGDPRPAPGRRSPSDAADGTNSNPVGNPVPKAGTAPTGGEEPQQPTEFRLASAVNNFNGPVFADGSTFGMGRAAAAGQRSRARTGKLTSEDIREDLDHFVPPAPFAYAVSVLANDHVAVLVGPSNIGKGASATALLRRVTTGPLAVLSPMVTISELADRDFRKGFGYVVKDWQHDQSAGNITDFTWRTLRDEVCDVGAHLVITTVSTRTRGTAESVRHFDWEPPATRDLLTSYLSGTAVEYLIDDIIGALPGECGIGPIVALARRLMGGEDPVKALEEFSNDAAARVQEWFAADPPLTEILEAIALAFTAGHSERAFETMLARLTKAVEDAGYALDAEAAGRKRKKNAPRLLRPVRRDRRRLIKRETVVAEGAARSIVNFRVASYRRPVLAVAWNNYDGTLWDAVRGWLEAVVDSAEDDRFDTKLAVAEGLATLAEVDMSEVEDSYLDPWAGGVLGWPGQLVAIYVLWYMCFSDTLAPVALRIATRWATVGDPVRRAIAGSALSGELGVRYPTEATNRLWHLMIQAKDSTGAISALAQLFATLTAGGRDAGQVLTLLNRRLEEVSGGPRRDLPQQKLITLSVMRVLSIRDARSGLPSITVFLQANPDRRAMAAELWGWVLRYRPLRRLALTALVEATSAFDNAGGEPEQEARALGHALASTLPHREREHLAKDLISLQAHSKQKHHETAAIMRALLAALERLNGTETGEEE